MMSEHRVADAQIEFHMRAKQARERIAQRARALTTADNYRSVEVLPPIPQGELLTSIFAPPAPMPSLAERIGMLAATEKPIPARLIMAYCAELTGVTILAMRGTTRLGKITLARQFAIWLVHIVRQDSLPATGRFFEKDHSTVMHSIRKIASRVAARDLEPEWLRIADLAIAGKLADLATFDAAPAELTEAATA